MKLWSQSVGSFSQNPICNEYERTVHERISLGDFRICAAIGLNPVPQCAFAGYNPEDYKHLIATEQAGLESLNWTVGQCAIGEGLFC